MDAVGADQKVTAGVGTIGKVGRDFVIRGGEAATGGGCVQAGRVNLRLEHAVQIGAVKNQQQFLKTKLCFKGIR